MNELVCVNIETENLLSRIPIRDFTFCDQFFVILGFFEKFDIFGKIGIFGKSDPGAPGGRFLGKVEVENSEKWGKNHNLRNKLPILPEF